MTDKDILISDLNDISEILNNNGYGGWCKAIRKAVALLKEQEERLRKFQKDKDKLCLEVSEWKHKYHDRPMKEQEAVEPHYNARTNWYECGACKFSMTSGMHCKGELIPAYKVGFCAKCGQAVKWE